MRKSILLIILLSISQLLFSQGVDFVYYNLKVVVDGTPQLNKSGDLIVSIYDNDDNEIYKETHTGLTTSPLSLLKVKIGKGTPNLGDFNSLKWNFVTYRVGFVFDGNNVKSGQKSYLQLVPYVMSAPSVKYIDTIQSQSADTVYVSHDLQFNDTLLIGVKETSADCVIVQKAVKIPVVPSSRLNDMDNPQNGAISYTFDAFDKTIMYYGKNKWNRLVGIDSIVSENAGVFNNTKIYTASGDQRYITNAISLLKGEEISFTVDLEKQSGLIKFESSDTNVVKVSTAEAASSEKIKLILNGYGLATITASSVENSNLMTNINVYVSSPNDDPDKVYSADIVPATKVNIVNPYDSIIPSMKYRFYAKNLNVKDPENSMMWRVIPTGMSKVKIQTIDTVDIVFSKGADYIIQLVERESGEIVSELQYRIKLNENAEVDTAGLVQPCFIDSRDGRGYRAKVMLDGNLWMLEDMEYLPHVNVDTLPIYIVDNDTVEDVALAKGDSKFGSLGVLYSLFALAKHSSNNNTLLDMNSKNLCPEGWELPGPADFINLKNLVVSEGLNFFDELELKQQRYYTYENKIFRSYHDPVMLQYWTKEMKPGMQKFHYYHIRITQSDTDKNEEVLTFDEIEQGRNGRLVRCLKKIN
jgi:uncharacterized protein (TIGR02145 family)